MFRGDFRANNYGGIEKVDQSEDGPTAFKNRLRHYLGYSSRRSRVTVLVIYSSYTVHRLAPVHSVTSR